MLKDGDHDAVDYARDGDNHRTAIWCVPTTRDSRQVQLATSDALLLEAETGAEPSVDLAVGRQPMQVQAVTEERFRAGGTAICARAGNS